MLRLLCAVAVALCTAGYSTAQTADTTCARVRTPEAGEPFRLAPGEAVEREGHEVVFVGVVEDSRCPTDVQCVWAGTARIRVTIDGEPFVLTLSPTVGSDDEAQMIEWGGVQAVFVGLEPYPQSVPPPIPGPVRALLITRPSNV